MKKYSGIFRNGKIIYRTRVHRALTKGNWKDGWGGIVKIGGVETIYNIINPENLIEGKRYRFKLVDDKNVEIINNI